MDDHLPADDWGSATVVLAVATLIAAVYLTAAARQRAAWPWHRTLCWVGGVVAVTAAIVGRIADRAHVDFAAHAVSHLLIGMIGPLLLVRAAPVTLALRTLPVAPARRLGRLLSSRPVAWLTDPVVAAVLAVGGMWVLYRTGLYAATQHGGPVHLAVHAHLVIAGYLFCTAMVGVDPLPHRRRHAYRAAVLVVSLAAHDILAKQLWADGAVGLPATDAETGAMIMYYGGDAVDVVIMVLLCRQWFRAVHRRAGRSTAPRPLLATR